MNMKKIIVSLTLVIALLTLSVGTVFAQETVEDVTGTVQSISIETDAETGETTVVVEVLDATTGESQFVRISEADAVALGLVTTDPVTGEPVVVEEAVGSETTIGGDVIIPDEDTGEEEQEHPVGSALGEYFGELLGVDYDMIMEFHEGSEDGDNGMGFGVIAQALWLTSQAEGAFTVEELLKAKRDHDYSLITLGESESTPENWGDVVKFLKKGENLGSIMSGKADNGEPDDEVETTELQSGKGNGKGNGKDNGKGNGKDNGHGNGKP